MAITRAQQARQLYQAGGGADFMEVKEPSPSLERIAEIKQANEVLNRLAEDKAQEPFETLMIKDSNLPGIGGTVLDALKGPRQKLLNRNVDFFRFDPRTAKAREKYGLTAQGYKDYMSARMAGEIDAAGNPIMDEDDDPFIPINQMSTNMDQAPEEEVLSPIQQAILDRGDASAFLATGGRVGLKGGADASQFDKSPSEQKSVDISPSGSVTLGSGPPEGPDDRASADQDMVQMLVRQGYTPKEINAITNPTIIDKVKESRLNNPLTRGMLRTGLYTLNPTLGPIDFRKAMQLKGVYDTTMDSINYPDEDDMTIGFAEGGPVGGIMDLESGRQMYFLGKLVKKATRAVKKIVKSPIGKAALFAAPFLMNPAVKTGIGSFLKDKVAPFLFKDTSGSFMNMLKGGLTGKGSLALGGALTLAPLLFQEDTNEDEYQKFLRERGAGAQLPASIADIRNNYRQYMGTAFLADGGKAEPVAKKTMPLLDMDGKEMDFRAEGGFVPIGRMERADDVPARLSKNEFVFTADAVRNAGEGDIDKGAEVMYNMMKNLEAGGEVSEESQGLEGARKMFQTSQRLEEVL